MWAKEILQKNIDTREKQIKDFYKIKESILSNIHPIKKTEILDKLIKRVWNHEKHIPGSWKNHSNTYQVKPNFWASIDYKDKEWRRIIINSWESYIELNKEMFKHEIPIWAKKRSPIAYSTNYPLINPNIKTEVYNINSSIDDTPFSEFQLETNNISIDHPIDTGKLEYRITYTDLDWDLKTWFRELKKYNHNKINEYFNVILDRVEEYLKTTPIKEKSYVPPKIKDEQYRSTNEDLRLLTKKVKSNDTFNT